MCIDTGANGRSTQGQFAKGVLQLLESSYAELRLPSVSPKFLTQANRSCILQMSSPDLDDMIKFLRLSCECTLQFSQRGNQVLLDRFHRGDVHSRRDHIVTRLSHVYMVIRVYRILRAKHSSQDLDCSIRDHLVNVHVCRSA